MATDNELMKQAHQLVMQQKYDEAISIYKKIKDKKLREERIKTVKGLRDAVKKLRGK